MPGFVPNSKCIRDVIVVSGITGLQNIKTGKNVFEHCFQQG